MRVYQDDSVPARVLNDGAVLARLVLLKLCRKSQSQCPARDLVLRCLSERIADAATGPGGRDYKTRLQEAAASRSYGRPRYVVRDEGPDHAKHFFAAVYVTDRLYGEGEGRSKKQAEQAAAWVAWTRLQEEAGEQGDDDAGAA